MAGRLFLTEFELMILLAIARLDENAYGVLIAREIEAATKRSVMLAAVYGALERLEAKDLVSSALGEATPESSAYTDIDRLVLNETGLTDAYTFTLNWAPTRQILGVRWDPSSELPSFPTALEEQTGLKLQPANAQVEVLVIQRASWPELD